MQRTISECVNDIKSILNNIEHTQECNGETLVDIDELVNEILIINGTKDESKEPIKPTENHNYFSCPVCNHIVSPTQCYCVVCGQKLKRIKHHEINSDTKKLEDKIKVLEKSNRNWRRKCQRMRNRKKKV